MVIEVRDGDLSRWDPAKSWNKQRKVEVVEETTEEDVEEIR